ncbi:hypothetical protein B6U80_01085 [Candidatus Pacearchaeota archaeon ex4484_26]|nr:MAG: hypothetical protein B6U80_01085 [Candidatus Pacearchaeota archaeon ex4484_26]RLF35164.1 MAG: hypothetical protein DRM99_05180 [Thermoplasmata archaeon]
MTAQILVMGKERDYYEIRLDRELLEKEIRETTKGISAGRLLDKLRTKNRISSNQLRNYGCTLSSKEDNAKNKNLIDCVEAFFQRAVQYADEHGAPYVLVQELKINQSPLYFDMSGLVQLLIE